MRVRQEAKILKNHYRESEWCSNSNESDTFEFPKSRYSPMRVWDARCRLIKACKRRYLNDARRAKKEGDITSYRLSIHNASSPYIVEDAMEWWNIGNFN